MRAHKRLFFVVAPAAVLATAAGIHSGAGAAAQNGPQPVTCHSNDIIEGAVGTVTIPAGNYCEILRAQVYGNVIGRPGAIQVGIDASTVTGNVTVGRVTDNGWICGSSIRGNVQITNADSNPETMNSPGYWAIGDPNWCTSSLDPVRANWVYGDLSFNDNHSGAVISGNDIEHNLRCAGNTPPPMGSANTADKAAKGQCSSLAGGPDTDMNSPSDAD